MLNRLLIFFSIALMITSCATDETETITGTWIVERMYIDTNDVTGQNTQGEQRWIKFNEDGSLTSDQFDGTWDYNDEDQILTINNTDDNENYFRWKVSFDNGMMKWQGAEGEEGNRMKVDLVRTDQEFTRTAPPATEEPVSTVKDTSDLNISKAMIEEIQVNKLESMPVQITVDVKGYLSDGCTTIHRVDRKKEGDTYIIDVYTERPKDAMCTQALVPFEQNVPLDVLGLSAGTYKVLVHDKEASFTLNVNNQ